MSESGNVSRPLILVGGGGHCRSVIEAAESAGMTISGILDTPENVGRECLNYPIVGSDEDIERYVDTHDFIITAGCVADTNLRHKLYDKVRAAGGHFGRVIARTAIVSRHAAIGDGTVVLHNAVVNAGARIGAQSIINTSAIVEHDTTIGDFTHVSTGAIVNGGCFVGCDVMVGSGAIVRQGISVCDRSIVGAGAVVVSDLTEQDKVYVGVPAKQMKDGRAR